MPPIVQHFHYCRSTLVYQIYMQRKELDKLLNKGLEYEDITNKFKQYKKHKVVEQSYFIDSNNNKYDVDDKNVILKPTQREKEVADMLGSLYGGEVKIVPRVNEPENIKTPDYIVKDEKFDLKQIRGNGKYVIQGNLKGKQEQSSNFIIDITKSKLDFEETTMQIRNIYSSKHYLWVDKIILIQNNDVLKIYKRSQL